MDIPLKIAFVMSMQESSLRCHETEVTGRAWDGVRMQVAKNVHHHQAPQLRPRVSTPRINVTIQPMLSVRTVQAQDYFARRRAISVILIRSCST